MPADLDYAIQEVNHSFRLLEFSIRVLNCFELKKVDTELFGQDSLIRLERENVVFNDSYFASKENCVLAAEMAIGASFGTSAIVLNDLFEAAYEKQDPKSGEEVFLIWSIVRGVRNAFAHGMADPRWQVYHRYRRKITLHLADKTTTLDLARLNGRHFEYELIGGLANWFHLKDRALDLIQP